MAWENNYSREAPFSFSPYSRALSSAIGRKTSFILIIDKQLEIKRKNHTPRKGWFHSLLSVSTSTLLTETREGLVDHGKGCNFGWTWKSQSLSQEKWDLPWTQCWEKSLEFHLLVPCVGELTWSPQPLSLLGTLSLRHCASIATGDLQPERKWSHKSPWNNFRKAFHEAARTENHSWQGVNEKEWKTLYLTCSCHNVWIRRINLVLVPFAAPGGLRRVLAPLSTQSFNRLILASLFSALSSVPVGWC